MARVTDKQREKKGNGNDWWGTMLNETDTQSTSHTAPKALHPHHQHHYPHLQQKECRIHLKNCISSPSDRGMRYRNSVNWLTGWMCSTVDQRETKMAQAEILRREKKMGKWGVCGWAFLLGVRDGTGVSARVQVRMVVPVRNGRYKHRHRCKRRADRKLEARARVRRPRMTLVVLVSPVRPLSPLATVLRRPSLPPVHPYTRYHLHLHNHNHQDRDKGSFRMKSSSNSWLVLTRLLSAYLDYLDCPGCPGCQTCQESMEGRKLVHPLSLLEELPHSELELVYPILLLLSPDPRSIYKLITSISVFHLLHLHFHHPQGATVPHLMDTYRRHLKGRQ